MTPEEFVRKFIDTSMLEHQIAEIIDRAIERHEQEGPAFLDSYVTEVMVAVKDNVDEGEIQDLSTTT